MFTIRGMLRQFEQCGVGPDQALLVLVLPQVAELARIWSLPRILYAAVERLDRSDDRMDHLGLMGESLGQLANLVDIHTFIRHGGPSLLDIRRRSRPDGIWIVLSDGICNVRPENILIVNRATGSVDGEESPSVAVGSPRT